VTPFSSSSWAALVVIGLLCLSLPDVFTVLFDDVLVINVGRVVVTSTAIDAVLKTVRGADRVVAGTTEQPVEAKTAIYAVVSASATCLILTTATVAIVVACQARDRVFGTEPVDPVQLRGAREIVLPKVPLLSSASATALSTITPTNSIPQVKNYPS
jgi:hypothetical protein